MTLEQFWDSNPGIVEVYALADAKRKEEQDRMNWIHGMYVLDAIASALSKDHKYMTKPILSEFFEESLMTEEELNEKRLKEMVLDMQNFANETNHRLHGD